MAIRDIIEMGDEKLYKKSHEITNFDSKLHTLLDDMADTMYNAEGVGLAAVQVGVLKRVVVIDIGDGFIELVNPEIVEESKERQYEIEGCLSLPGENVYTNRPMKVTVKGQDRNGKWQVLKGSGLKARAFCHELDHLDGIVIRDIAISKPEDK